MSSREASNRNSPGDSIRSNMRASISYCRSSHEELLSRLLLMGAHSWELVEAAAELLGELLETF